MSVPPYLLYWQTGCCNRPSHRKVILICQKSSSHLPQSEVAGMQVPVKIFLKKILNLSQNAKRVRQSVYRTPLDGLLESVGMDSLTFGYSYAAAYAHPVLLPARLRVCVTFCRTLDDSMSNTVSLTNSWLPMPTFRGHARYDEFIHSLIL